MKHDLREISSELKKVRALLEQPRQVQAEPQVDYTLEGSVDSLRRLLSETIEQRMESVIRELAVVRSAAATDSPDSLDALKARIDRLMKELGALPFEAERLEYVDPLIHMPVEERNEPDAPDGAVLETLQPGFRTGRGTVVCRASVVVNRRS